MNKFYITYESGRKCYAYKYENDKIKYIALNKEQEALFFTKTLERNITNITDKDKSMEIVFEDNFSVVVDNSKIFLAQHNEYDRYFFRLLDKIKRFTERENLRKVHTQTHTRRVNRNKSKKMPKAISASALSLSIGFSLIAGLMNKEITKKDESLLPQNVSEIVMNRENIDELIENQVYETYEEEVDTVVKLAFSDRTESNRVSEEASKLEETEAYFGSIISNYAIRYGLPYELACAQITQERPNIKDGKCDNICQITYELFIGRTLTVPIYNEQGFTGEYETFEVTKEMLDTPDGNIKTCLAYKRICVDKFNSLILGLFSYNQGEYALNIACNYYGLNKEDYYGDENAIKARDLINRYYEEQGKKHGDSTYLENVFSYLNLNERGSTYLEYYLGSEKKTVEIINTLVYNNELSR